MVSQRSVLIVDRCEDSREVLKTALERRGLRILEASRARHGLELARRHRPDLIVLDAEVDDSGPEAVCAPFARQSQADRTALVILGGLCRRDRGSTDGEFVPKPYHYGPLVRKIEALLSAAGQTYARSA